MYLCGTLDQVSKLSAPGNCSLLIHAPASATQLGSLDDVPFITPVGGRLNLYYGLCRE